MFSGLLLGVGAAFLFSLVNIVDKYLIERFSKDSGIGALIILSSLFPVTLIPIALIIEQGAVELSVYASAVLILSGALTTTWVTLYLLALEDDDVSRVMPIFQFTPVAAFILAFIFLGEMPEVKHLIAGVIIVLGSFVLGYELSTGKFKWRLLWLIVGASIAIALMNTLFKLIALDASFWTSIFWQAIGTVLSGLILFAAHKNYRRQFIAFIKENTGIGLSLNTANESLTLAGDVLFAFAILLAPLALVQTTEAFQPVFVFFIGLAVTLLSPKLFKEDLSKESLVQKILGISVVFFGTLLLYIL